MDIEGLIDGHVGTCDEGLQGPPVPRASGHIGDKFRDSEPLLRSTLLKQGTDIVGKAQDGGHDRQSTPLATTRFRCATSEC